MRIIGGEYKRKKLNSVPGMATRPTADRVKENMFNMLYSYNPEIFYENKVAMDLFAGTGALGIEALSRGTGRAVFIDNSREALTVLENNISACHYGMRSTVIRRDIIHHRSLVLPDDIKNIDVVFMDPPYNKGYIGKTVERLTGMDGISGDTLIVAEHEKTFPHLISSMEQCIVIKSKDYGRTSVTIFRLND